MPSQISPLSYIQIPQRTPTLELLPAAHCHWKDLARYFTHCKNTPVFALKWIPRTSEWSFEIYLYRYIPTRSDWKIIDIYPPNIGFDKNTLFQLQPHLRRSDEFAKHEHIILSFDVDMDNTLNNIVHYYYGAHRCRKRPCPTTSLVYLKNMSGYTYYTVDETEAYELSQENCYGLIDDILSTSEQAAIPYLELLREPLATVFYAVKPQKNTDAVYVEGMSFKMFKTFLFIMSYPKETIQTWTTLYDDSYVFSVSYDIDKQTRKVVKSTTFGILH